MVKAKREKHTSECEHCGISFEGKRKYCTERCRKILECKAKGLTRFRNAVVAPLFQRMIRAEYAARPAGRVMAVRGTEVIHVYRAIGQCVCVTCGKIHLWNSGIEGMHTGHFVSSRRSSILFEERNVAPQCSSCNRYRNGAPTEYQRYMEAVYGVDVIEELERLKAMPVSFTRIELVDMWLEYSERLKAAKERMNR